MTELRAFHGEPGLDMTTSATEFYSKDLDRVCLESIASGVVVVDSASGRLFSRRGREIGKTVSTRGYCVVTVHAGGSRRQVKVHRLVWLAAHGTVPNGEVIDHVNRVKTDNRIANLRTVAPKTNSANRRSYKGTANPASKIDDATAQRIRDRHTKLHSYAVVANEFNVSRSLVAQIVRGELWSQ